MRWSYWVLWAIVLAILGLVGLGYWIGFGRVEDPLVSARAAGFVLSGGGSVHDPSSNRWVDGGMEVEFVASMWGEMQASIEEVYSRADVVVVGEGGAVVGRVPMRAETVGEKKVKFTARVEGVAVEGVSYFLECFDVRGKKWARGASGDGSGVVPFRWVPPQEGGKEGSGGATRGAKGP